MKGCAQLAVCQKKNNFLSVSHRNIILSQSCSQKNTGIANRSEMQSVITTTIILLFKKASLTHCLKHYSVNALMEKLSYRICCLPYASFLLHFILEPPTFIANNWNEIWYFVIVRYCCAAIFFKYLTNSSGSFFSRDRERLLHANYSRSIWTQAKAWRLTFDLSSMTSCWIRSSCRSRPLASQMRKGKRVNG